MQYRALKMMTLDPGIARVKHNSILASLVQLRDPEEGAL